MAISPNAYSTRKEIAAEFRLFTSRTTLRVVPRFVKALSWKARCIWICVFLGLLITASLCVYLLVDNYIKFFSTFEKVRGDSNTHGPFPSVTLCLHRPLALDMISKLSETLTPRFFVKSYENSAKYYENISQKIPGGQPGMTQYYQIYPSISLVHLMSRRQEEAILRCQTKTNSDTLLGEYDTWDNCSLIPVSISGIFIPEYFRCFMLTMPVNVSHTATGLFLFINLQNYLTNDTKLEDLQSCRQCIPWSYQTWRIGARVYIHTPNTRPDEKSNFYVDLSAGSVNQILFTPTLTRRLPPPHGVCGEVPKKELIIQDKLHSFNYTPEACMAHKMQLQIISKCNCSDASLPQVEVWSPLVDNCEKLYLNKDLGFWQRTTPHKVHCMEMVKHEVSLKQLKAECPIPCEEYSYIPKVSSTLGFDRTVIPFLYNDLGRSILDKKGSPIRSLDILKETLKTNNLSAAHNVYYGSAQDLWENF